MIFGEELKLHYFDGNGIYLNFVDGVNILIIFIPIFNSIHS